MPEGSPDGVLRDITRWSVTGTGAIEPLATVADADALVDLADNHGLLGPLVTAVRAGSIDVGPAAAALALERHERAMVWCLHLERRLLEVEDRFDAAGGVAHRVLKGTAVAHLDDADPSLRSFADLDLLVDGRDMDRAIRLLADLGATRRIPERRPGFDRRFVKGVGTRCDDGVEIDVHRNLCGGPHGFRIPPTRLFAELETFDLAGRALPALSTRHRMLHACYHAVVGSSLPPLRTLRDLAGYLGRADLAPNLVADEAQRWGGEAVLVTAVRECIDAFDLDVPAWSEWIEGRVVEPGEARIMARGRVEGDHVVDWAEVGALPWSDRPAFLFAVAFPSREVLAERGDTQVGRFVAGARRGWSQIGRRIGLGR